MVSGYEKWPLKKVLRDAASAAPQDEREKKLAACSATARPEEACKAVSKGRSGLIFSLLFCLGTQLYADAPVDKNICELNVYVHGTYGPMFSFISYPWVRKDALKGTRYVSLQRMLRDSQFAQHRRLMGDHGLTEVTPGIDLPAANPARHVMGALTSIHKELNTSDTVEHRHFLFGWSGLLSQCDRRYESIRLYNELVALVEQVKAAGKTPVLKVYAHSHGCNVLLNLALVDACAFDMAALPSSTNPDVVKHMQKLFLDGIDDNDVWYKKPIKRLEVPLYITMLCIPVQPETAPLVASPLFTRVVQIYSDNDGITTSDYISSTKPSAVHFDTTITQGRSHIKIIRWLNDRSPLDVCAECEKPKKKWRIGPLKHLSRARLNRLKNGGGNPDCHHPNDPTHADFWSVGNKRDGAFFEEVPLLVFMPLVEDLLTTAGDKQRLDFCLLDENDSIAGALFAFDDQQKPELCSMKLVSSEPLLAARKSIQSMLSAAKKLTVNVKLTLPFWNKKLDIKK